MRPQPRASCDRPAGNAPRVRRISFVLLTSGSYSEFHGCPTNLVRSHEHRLASPPPTLDHRAAKSRSRGAPSSTAVHRRSLLARSVRGQYRSPLDSVSSGPNRIFHFHSPFTATSQLRSSSGDRPSGPQGLLCTSYLGPLLRVPRQSGPAHPEPQAPPSLATSSGSPSREYVVTGSSELLSHSSPASVGAFNTRLIPIPTGL
ncbi:hypothetical protein NDU88_003945 [Pleurodeles waltl]|uniref:Uncharacterized protein n=1 Tax=Pleurodeles waltl TaxID=8319 RepID=A0AAV7UFS9_PLEWA|nr:hypothetical protein NDU88_003945 [Pleurodeles waltl]